MYQINLNTKKYSGNFVTEFLPRIIKIRAKAAYQKNPVYYTAVSEVLRNDYHISLLQAIDLCAGNFIFERYNDKDGRLVQNSSTLYKNIPIAAIYNLINDGNLSIRGTRLFYNILKDINRKLMFYYRIYLFS